MEYFIVLLIPIFGLTAICRTGKWNWKIVESSLFNALLWLGWFTALIVAVIGIITSIFQHIWNK
jgi:hypothetical protein